MSNVGEAPIPMEPPIPPVLRTRPWTRWVRWFVTMLILALTLWFMAGQIRDAWRDLDTRALTVRPAWIAASAVIFAGGLFVLGSPWYCILHDRTRAIGADTPLPFFDVSRVFVISQLGKYVPGKAVVLLIRFGLLSPRGVTLGMATLTTVFETLVSMGSCAALAAVLLAVPTMEPLAEAVRTNWYLLPMAVLFAVGLAGLMIPPIFAILPHLFGRLFASARHRAGVPVAWSTFGRAFLGGFVGWSIVGVSFWACVQSVADEPLGLVTIPAMMATFSLAYVTGFASMVPGHLGVREVVMNVILVPILSGDQLVAVAAIVISRLVTLVTELVVGWLVYLTFRTTPTKRPIGSTLGPNEEAP